MSDWQGLFVHRPEFGIIVCKKCEYAVVPKQAERHIKDHHPHTTKEQRVAIVQSIKALPHVAQQHNEVRYPRENEAPVAGLPVYTDGLQCRECAYVCRHIQKIQEHCRREHGWVNRQRRGGISKMKKQHSSNRLWDIGVSCQRFFQYAQWFHMFAVRVDDEPATPSGRQASKEVASTVLGSVRAARTAQHAERCINGDLRRVEANPWLEFVGWHRHLAGYRVKDLLQSVWPAQGEAEFDESIHESQNSVYGEETEAALARACQATKRMIRYAFASSTVDHVGRAALEAVFRRETGAKDNEKPFNGKLKVQSIRKYMQVWVKMLRYIWRTAGQDDMPRYRLTDAQRICLRRLHTVCQKKDNESRSEAKKRQEAAEKASIVFWIAMFDQELGDSEFESGIVSAMAVLGLNDDGEWMSVLVYTPKLSAVITTMRAVVVHRAWLSRQQAIQRAIDDGMEEQDAHASAPTVVKAVDALTQRFMTLRQYGGVISPMDRLYHQRTYGLKVRFTTKVEGRLSWQGERLCIDRISFGMDDVRSVVHGLVETVRCGLVDELLLLEANRNYGWKPDRLPVIAMDKLFDNPAELSAGWSFLADARTEWGVDGRDWMGERMFAESGVKRRFITHCNDGVRGFDDVTWNESGIEQYFQAVRGWKEQLMVLAHLSAGAPARATELLSIQHKNGGASTTQRGIFIEDRMMALVTTYHKGYSASGRFKVIHRFVPDEVAEIVVYFLWLVQPFVEQLQYVSGTFTGEPTSFLWEPEAEEEWIAGEDEELEDELDSEEPNTDEGDEEGFTPPKAEAVPANVDGFWDTNRVRRVMQRETEKRIGVKIGVALWRQAYPAIQRQFSVDSSVKDTIDQLYEGVAGSNESHAIEAIRAKQAAHALDIEARNYGVLMSENPFATMHEREQFRHVSMDWHRLLHFQSVWQDHGRIPRQVQQHAEVARQEARRWRYEQMRSVDIDVQLRRVLQDEHAEFRGVQRVALQAIVGGVPRITVVMRTGGGKSLCFLIPAAGSKDGITIVVVPLVSLQQDLVGRCEQAGLLVAAWDGRRPPYYARIIFVTPESAVTLAFGRFIDEKRTSHQLERIVVDECHTVLEASAKWRPKMLRLQEMAQKDVQVVYLTATLPLRDEEAWLGVVGVARKDMYIIRDVTTRPSIAYSVVKYEVKEEEQRVKELVERKLAQYADGQVIVYCRTIEQVKRVADYTGGQAFFRAIGTSEDKARILRRLTGEQTRLFVATNALGMGVDAPRIRCVVHVGSPSEMKQYAQESGRAGRDGVASEAIVMRAVEYRRGEEKVVGEWKMDGMMQRFLEGKECRRVVYDEHMDGRMDRVGCEDGEEVCDVCEGLRGRVKRRRLMSSRGQKGEEERGVVNDGTGLGMVEGGAGLGIVEDVDGGDVEDVDEGEVEVDGGEVDSRSSSQADERNGELRSEGQEMDIKGLSEQMEAIQQRARVRVVQRQLEIEQFEGLLRRWQGRCSICIACGVEEQGHSNWRQCRQAERLAGVSRCWQRLGGIRYQYSACYRCHAPQGVCRSWQGLDGSKSGRFRKRGARMNCQFEGVVRDVGAAIWGIGSEGAVGDWLREQLQRGFKGVEEEAIVEFFGSRFVEGGVEVSGLCRMIWQYGQVE